MLDENSDLRGLEECTAKKSLSHKHNSKLTVSTVGSVSDTLVAADSALGS